MSIMRASKNLQEVEGAIFQTQFLVLEFSSSTW